MPIDFLDFMFEAIIFILIIHQSRYYLSTYLFPMIKDDYEMTCKEKERLSFAIERIKKSIVSKEVLLIQQTEHLSVLEKMVDRWHEKRIKNQEKQRANKKSLLSSFNEKIQVQLSNHTENKKQIHALKTCSLHALEQIQKETPYVYAQYTKKALSLFLSHNKEKE
jgi:hypothetical protein